MILTFLYSIFQFIWKNVKICVLEIDTVRIGQILTGMPWMLIWK